VPALPDALSPRMHTLLRRAVLDFRSSERRRTFTPVLHVGVPGEKVLAFDPSGDEPMEHGLRADLVAALLGRARTSETDPLVWLTRTGDFVLEDADAAWLAAAKSAYDEATVPLTMVVVTRRGWWDPWWDRRREWKRLRRR
jgi:hypothetical protein